MHMHVSPTCVSGDCEAIVVVPDLHHHGTEAPPPPTHIFADTTLAHA